jgi:hypothetical protein
MQISDVSRNPKSPFVRFCAGTKAELKTNNQWERLVHRVVPSWRVVITQLSRPHSIGQMPARSNGRSAGRSTRFRNSHLLIFEPR